MKKIIGLFVGVVMSFTLIVMVRAATDNRTTQQVTVIPGQSFTIDIPDDESTGYSWKIVYGPDSKVVSSLNNTFTSLNGKQIGAGGVRHWKFQAKKAGLTKIIFWSAQWYGDPSESGIKTHTVTVNVVKRRADLVKMPTALKSYKNTQYGFELSYPSSWVVQQTADEGIMINPADFSIPTSGIVTPYFSFAATAHSPAVEEEPVKKIYGTQEGYVYPNGKMIFFPFKNGDRVGGYLIQYRTDSIEVNQILGTLKFST